MSALLVLIIAGFTGFISAICFKRSALIEAAVNADPNHILFSAQELAVAGIFFGTASAILAMLAIVIAVKERNAK